MNEEKSLNKQVVNSNLRKMPYQNKRNKQTNKKTSSHIMKQIIN